MIKKPLSTVIKITSFYTLLFSITACTEGKVDPAKALSTMHITKSDDYKKRPGWDAVVGLAQNDCETQKSGGESLIKWEDGTCDAKSIIDFVNKNPKSIPLFYSAYHEYGSYEVGEISSFESSTDTKNEDISKIIANLSLDLSSKEKVDAIYADYENDRWSMGLNKVSEDEFKKIVADFASKKEKYDEEYQKVSKENQIRRKVENDAIDRQEQAAILASDRPISLVLWANPTTDQQIIINALKTIKFSIRSDGTAYANGRFFMAAEGLKYLENSLNMSMYSCSDVGAYSGENGISRACVQVLAQNIIEWGKTAKDTSISDRAWRAGDMDAVINYNPIKFEILFGHWAGMARVYASRGY